VAEGIRDNKMPEHKKAIATKTSLYRWVEERAAAMLNKMFAPGVCSPAPPLVAAV
jgi:hypothetical protein